MRFFGTAERELSIEETLEPFRRYREYLSSVKGRMPHGAWSYAAADWHYDYDDHRSPHDSWLESIVINEPSKGSRSEIRRVEMAVTLLGAYHDGHLILEYSDIAGYALTLDGPCAEPPGAHGDLIVDEVLWSEETGRITHELLFERQGCWRIEAADLACRWVPF